MKTLALVTIWACTACLPIHCAGAGTTHFVEKTLALKKVSTGLFGSPLDQFSDAEAMPPGGPALDLDAGLDWYRTEDSASYEKDHPGRLLRYGFRDGRLVAVRVFSGFAFDPDQERAARIRESLSRIFLDFKRLPGQGMARQDESLRVRYASFCRPEENIFAVIVITPPKKE